MSRARSSALGLRAGIGRADRPVSCPGGLFALGTDGFGRSEDRANLRRHFEVDAESITVAALYRLCQCGCVDPNQVSAAIAELGIDPEKIDPARA